MRRMNLKREDGVAMTEFALIVPVFLLIVAGLLAFGRVFFYWIEANHMASETARWAVVDRNPYAPGADAAAARGAELHGRVRERREGLHRLPAARHRRSRRARAGADPEAVQLRPHPRASGRSRSAAPRRCASSASRTTATRAATTTTARTTSGRAREHAAARRARRHARHGGRDDPRVPAADGARRRRRELVHAQAPAPEPRRRRRIRRGRRVREELEGLRPDRRRRAARVDRRRDRGRGARSTPATPRPPTTAPAASRPRSGTPRSRTRRTSTSSSTRTTRTTPTTPTTPTAAARRRRGTRATCTRPATTSPRRGHWTDVRVKERDLPSLFGSVGLPLSRNGARARIEIRPAISGHQFLPLAVPNNVITKVQVRYYDECTSRPDAARDARSRAAPTATRAPSRAWARSGASRTAGVGDPHPGVHPHAPDATARLRPGVPARRRRGADREPRRDRLQRQHVRAAPRDAVRRLLLTALADPHLERRQRRQPGADRRRPPDRWLRQQRHPDAYFGTLPVARDQLPLRRQRLRQLGRPRRPANENRPRPTSRSRSTASRRPLSGLDGDQAADEPVHRSREALTASPGANTVTVSSTGWTTPTSLAHLPGTDCRNGGSNPASTATAEPVHQMFVGTAGHGRRRRVRAHLDRRRGTRHAEPAGRRLRDQ